MNTAIFITQIVIAVFAFGAVIIITMKYRPEKAVIKAYERVDGRLRVAKKGFFNYEKTNQFLSSHGAAYHYGEKMTPLKFIFTKIAVAIICFAIGAYWHIFASVVLMVLGYNLPSLVLIYEDKQDNKRMLPQIQGLYHILQEQIRAGVYVTDALSECYRGIESGRLKKGLEYLSGELLLQKPFVESMEKFQSKFNNPALESLCIILIQAQESGQSMELLADMSSQIRDMQATLLIQKKEKLIRVETLCLMGIFAAVLAVILYACIGTMMSSVLLS